MASLTKEQMKRKILTEMRQLTDIDHDPFKEKIIPIPDDKKIPDIEFLYILLDEIQVVKSMMTEKQARIAANHSIEYIINIGSL